MTGCCDASACAACGRSFFKKEANAGYKRGDAVEFRAMHFIDRGNEASTEEFWVPATYECTFNDNDEPVLLHVVSERGSGTVRHVYDENLRKAQKNSKTA